MADWIIQAVTNIPAGWAVFLLSMLPVTELRVAIPLGVAWGLAPAESFFWAIGGNFVPIIPLLLLLGYILRWLKRFKLFAAPLKRLEAHNQRRQEQVRRYGMIGLTLLVAVPLPGTGIWTGCLVATLLSLPFWPAVAAITAGEVIAGILVAAVTSGAMAVSELMYGEYLLLFLALLIIVLLLLRRRKRR